MNKKSWLIVGLSLAMAASIGVGISACGGKEPDTPPTPTEHTHNYDAWDHNDTQHWKYCDEHGTNKSNIDETTREGHIFTNGTCECGMKEADVTPDEGLDTRVFYVVGSGAGDLSKCSFTELKSNFMLTKQPKKDENGYTVYATAALTLYAGDTMKIVQDLKWDEGLGYFGVSNIKNNDGSLVDGGGPGNITPAVGKDGKYIFIIRTKPDISFAQCTLEVKFVEPVEPLKKTEEIYIVGGIQYCNTKWPSGKDVTGCQKLDYDEETGEWSIVLRLGGYMEGSTLYHTDEFKLFNAVNGAYIPDGVNNNKLVSGATDHTDPTSKKFYKAAGDYKISWKKGDVDVTFTKLEHTHVFDRTVSDADQHWTACWLDDTQKPDTTRENHVWENEQDTMCDVCGKTRHIHTYDTWDWDEEEHWKYCDEHGTNKGNIDETTRKAHTVDPETHLCECGYEQHTHEYTKWEHDAKQHWKVCPKDNEVDPETPKAPHSFDPDTHTCECGYEHTHEYTKYNYNDDEHWKECPTDGDIDEETRTTHTFDQTGDKCVCGKGKPDCEHSNGYAFAYEELPAAEADGGTLEKICPDCKGKQTVTYSKGFTGNGDGTVGEISVGTSYFTTGNDKTQVLGLKITEAGTYTFTFEEVCDLNETDGQIGLRGLTFGTAYADGFGRAKNSLVYGSKVTSKADVKSQIETYAVKYNGEALAADTYKNSISLSFTVTAEQLQEGALYVTLELGGYLNDTHSYLSASNSMSCLVTVTKSAAAPVSAPAEVALLPEKKD